MMSKMLQIQHVRFFTGILQSTRILLLITLVLAFNTVFAQKALKIYKHDGSITDINASAIDSIKFNTPLAIGDSYQGGIIFYLDASGEHGLIAAPSDNQQVTNWDKGLSTEILIGATGDSIGAGRKNTYKIIGNLGSGGYAAMISTLQSFGGYKDWYLPSKYELNLMYLQKAKIGGFASGVVYVNNSWYWSSTEDNGEYVWFQNFDNGSQAAVWKGAAIQLRAIRAF